MEQVAIYARVSTVDLQNYERQISDLTKVIKDHGYKEEQIVIFSEKISGYKKDKDRPELTKLLNQIEDNPKLYKCVYVTEISRIGRDPKNTTLIVDTLIELGVPLYIESINQFTIDNKGEKNIIVSIILKVLMEFAHLESQTMKSRMKSGKVEAVRGGKISGANQAFGYMGDENKKLVINPIEAAIVEQIFQLYKEGNGTIVIANTLTQMGVKTRLNTTHSDKVITFSKTNSNKTGDSITWSSATIRQIINNTIYMGDRNFKGHVFNSPVIISKELFDECNDLMKTKTHRNYLTSYEYLLKDMIRCGDCGRKYFGKYSPTKKGDKVYKCTSGLGTGKSCGNLSMNISLLESVLYDQVLNSDTLLKYLDNPNDILRQLNSEIKMLGQQLKNEESNLDSKEKELGRLLKLYLSNDKYRTMFEQNEVDISKEIKSIQDKIILINRDIFSKTLTVSKFNVKAASKEMIVGAMHNRPELRSIFQQFIDKIVINTLNKKYSLATVFVKVNGIPLKNTLKLYINSGGVRAVRFHSNKVYQYAALTKMENDPVFKDNILMVDKDDIVAEIENEVKLFNESDGLLGKELITIDKENYMYINAEDI